MIRTCLKEKNAYFIFRLGLDGKIYFVPVLLRYCNRALNEREKGGCICNAKFCTIDSLWSGNSITKHITLFEIHVVIYLVCLQFPLTIIFQFNNRPHIMPSA